MKKKGLIIATIVMVLVLAISLTTATYAWFTTSSVTKIDAFNVSVATNNAVKIGVKANNTYAAEPNESMFKTGDVEWANATDGTFASGEWTGDLNGLSASINHNIAWGQQSQAIGWKTTALTDEQISAGGTLLGLTAHGTTSQSYVYAASGDDYSASASLSNVKKAVANTDNAASPATPTSDYVHLFLGAAPTRTLATNELIITIDPTGSTSTTLGILSAIHVAWRKNSNGDWTDVDMYGEKHATSLISSVTTNLTDEEKETYKTTYSKSSISTTGIAVLKITGLKTAVNEIDQIELLIYIDGLDSDCTTASVSNITGAVSIFFHTTDPVTP